MKKNFCVVFITVPVGPVAKKIAGQILRQRLAACVNIVPRIGSIYWWKGKMESANESLLIAKTREIKVKTLMQLIKRIHPYDVPEVISLPIHSGSAPYLAWLAKETK